MHDSILLTTEAGVYIVTETGIYIMVGEIWIGININQAAFYRFADHRVFVKISNNGVDIL